MPKPIRTLRLSIIAIASIAAFALVAAVGVRSFWMWDQWHIGMGKIIAIENGCVFYAQNSDPSDRFPIFKHNALPAYHMPSIDDSIPAQFSFAGFSERRLEKSTIPIAAFSLSVPLWPLLLLLLITPLRWRIALPSGGPAFAVIIDAKKESL